MPTNEIPNTSPAADLDAFDQALREIGAGISIAEARTQRLVAAAFSNVRQANDGIRHIMTRTGDVEEVIRAMQGGGLNRSWRFGQTRTGWLFFGQRHAARTALAELPDALRELHQLCRKQQDLTNGRRIHLAQRIPADTQAQRFTWTHTQRRGRSQRMS